MSKLFTLLFFVAVRLVTAQEGIDNSLSDIEFLIHEEVTNSNGEIEQELIQLWQGYIRDGNFQDPESPYWSFENMRVPDENFWALGLTSLNDRNYKVQCKVIGVFEVDHGYWSLISSFSHIDSLGEIHLDVITAVYAKEYEDGYLLVSSAEYLKTVFELKRFGSINYYIHPFHKFVPEQADQMNAYNTELSKVFGVDPLEFDYFAASNARDISRTWGYEYMNRMYNPSGKGGVASWRNMIIYSGNNSSYYPHELVHLYTYHVHPHDPHFWVGEGIATYYAGTATYTFDGHMGKLKEFLAEQPDYDLSDITKLNKTIPNGEHKSDMRYVIGGLLMKCIYDKEGVEGLVESLQYGTSNDDFFRLLEDKLGVTRSTFDNYVKEQTLKYELIDPDNEEASVSVTPRVTGIGGIFFKGENREGLKDWYRENLGMTIDDFGAPFEFRNAERPDELNFLNWDVFVDSSTYFNPSSKGFMINYRVVHIEQLVDELRDNGVMILDDIETYSFGKFVHIMDPEGNKIELWEPEDQVLSGMGRTTNK